MRTFSSGLEFWGSSIVGGGKLAYKTAGNSRANLWKRVPAAGLYERLQFGWKHRQPAILEYVPKVADGPMFTHLILRILFLDYPNLARSAELWLR